MIISIALVLITAMVCSTTIYLFKTYATPYIPYEENKLEVDEDGEREPSFEDIIREIYGRRDEDE